MITRKCDWCNIEYTARSTRGKTCSRKCSDDLYNSGKRDNSKRKYYRTCISCSVDFTTASGSRERCLDCSDKIKSDRELIKDVKSDIKDTKNAFNNLSNTLDECLKLLDSLRECTVCGRDYYKDNGRNYKVCSDKCYDKVKYKAPNINKDKRLSRNGKPDYSISLDKLIDRDGLSCHICGGVTNKEDKYIHRDGKTIICGNDYPSIDHVIPIAKGGLHRWDNVKVAHRICNSQKRDKTY